MNIREATETWVNGFNAIKTNMIEKLMEYDPEDWAEVTPFSEGDRVYVANEDEGEVIGCDHALGTYKVMLDCDGQTVDCTRDEMEAEYFTTVPDWGTMWSFNDSCDEWWIENKANVRAMADIGFRVYKSNQFGYFFGTDSGGTDFYDLLWIPLYKARGLHWHDNDE